MKMTCSMLKRHQKEILGKAFHGEDHHEDDLQYVTVKSQQKEILGKAFHGRDHHIKVLKHLKETEILNSSTVKVTMQMTLRHVKGTVESWPNLEDLYTDIEKATFVF